MGQIDRSTWWAIAVAALGYFVDIFDIVLFTIVRVPSLSSLGLSGDSLLKEGLFLLNVQMAGMLLGGIIFGVWGDKRGRLSVLFGSILLYSVANICNAFVTSVEAYALWRFLAGIGLAGELGAGITLVSELMPKESRGYATTCIATVGVSGALVAAVVAEHFSWQAAYLTGGVLGLALLGARIIVHESGMFERVKQVGAKRGDFFMLFRSWRLFRKYFCSVFVGLPIWFVVGILIGLAPEFGAAFGMQTVPTAGVAVFYAYLGFVVGDLASGLFSQMLRSRRKALGVFIVLTCLAGVLYLRSRNISLTEFKFLCLLLGFSAGYWAVFVTVAAEQFGTNIRATVATTAPNFVRGAVVPVTIGFQALQPQLGIVGSAYVIGGATIIIALLCLWSLDETYGSDLDFVEGSVS